MPSSAVSNRDLVMNFIIFFPLEKDRYLVSPNARQKSLYRFALYLSEVSELTSIDLHQ